MYTIYAIVNTITNTYYVGLTRKPPDRKLDHFARLLNNKHDNRYLQNAYNKYGKVAFVWEVLESSIETIEKANEREIYWITQFSSVYNLSKGGYGTANSIMQPCIWNGIEYESVTSAALALNIPQTTMNRYIKKGYTCDNDVPPATRAVIWNDIEYSELNQAAKAIGVTRKTMRTYLERGYERDSDIPRLEKPTIWNGVEYKSINDAARANGIPKHSMKEWVAKGYKSDNDIPPPQAKPVTWNGVQYGSIADAARELGRERKVLTNWLAKGYTCDDDVPYLIRKHQRK